jgi:hypothetical protein
MRVSRGNAWDVYRDGRWPQCSCCGEPMPCRAEVQDRQIDAAMDRVEEMSKRLPGCCWGCGNPITSRQQSVIYAGENLDLPGGPDVRFHLRLDCLSAATAYETKWLSVDHSRRRMLTYPKCSGSCSGTPTAAANVPVETRLTPNARGPAPTLTAATQPATTSTEAVHEAASGPATQAAVGSARQ